MIEKVIYPETVAFLFKQWEETLIWSCLQQVMGSLYTNNIRHPQSVMAILGDFAFYAGIPEKELVLYKPDWCKQDFLIMVPENEAWAALIEQCYPEKAKKVLRYATKKEPDAFDIVYLQKIVASLPKNYELKPIGKAVYDKCKTMDWCKDWVSQYPDHSTWEKYGLGFVITRDKELLAGASSYSRYQTGIEIEIDTHKSFRRQGLASICGAKLILACLEKNLYPSWDAQNTNSLALAKKLGYHYSHTYTAYEIWGY